MNESLTSALLLFARLECCTFVPCNVLRSPQGDGLFSDSTVKFGHSLAILACAHRGSTHSPCCWIHKLILACRLQPPDSFQRSLEQYLEAEDDELAPLPSKAQQKEALQAVPVAVPLTDLIGDFGALNVVRLSAFLTSW